MSDEIVSDGVARLAMVQMLEQALGLEPIMPPRGEPPTFHRETPMTATAKKSRAGAAAERHIKVGENGALLKPNASEWVAVLDTRANLMWAVEVLERMTFKKAQAAVKKLTIAGFKDWRLPTVEELFCLADRSRVSPAIDVDFFPDTPSEWFWTGTVYAPRPSDCAWVVSFGDGGSSWGGQYDGCRVRAVRPGQ